MKSVARILIVLALLAAMLPVRAAAAKPPADPTCAEVAKQLGASYESIELDGSITCVMYPPKKKWNQDMVVFAHGYMDTNKAIGIPWDQLIRPQSNLPEIVIRLGYAFATTSYSKNGLAIKEGVTDVVKLVEHVRDRNKKINRVFLTGASEGGLVTALAIEKYPQYFAGGLSTCGPIGSFLGQVQYWVDFRIKFDQYFPYVLAAPYDPINLVQPFGRSTPVYIAPEVVVGWDSISTNFVTPWLVSSPADVQALLTDTQVPIDPADPVTTAGQSILELLYYNVQATNDGRLVLNPAMTPDQLPPPSLLGNPYENTLYVTPDYPNGITRDPTVIPELMANYETSANLSRQLVLMHTTGDPVIPIAQPVGYLQKSALAGSLGKVAFLPIDRYGHCNFTAPELVLGFYTMVIRSTLIPFSAEQIQEALPDAQQLSEFKQLKEMHKDKEKGN